MSQPPDYPGRQRFKRVAAAAGSEAYQGAFEAIGSVLIAGGFGYWVDYRWETAPYGLLVGMVIGFAAMVLRLVRLGKEVHPDTPATTTEPVKQMKMDPSEDFGVGESPGLSSALREERRDDPNDESAEKEERNE